MLQRHGAQHYQELLLWDLRDGFFTPSGQVNIPGGAAPIAGGPSCTGLPQEPGSTRKSGEEAVLEALGEGVQSGEERRIKQSQSETREERSEGRKAS